MEGSQGQVPATADGEESQELKNAEGQEPNADDSGKPQEGDPKTFDEEYVKELRQQAAQARGRATKAERQLNELREASNAGLSDTERLSKAAEAAELRADAAELKASAYEVAASRSLDLKWASYLSGDTREAQEEKADELVKLLAAQGPPKATSFDGGVRQTPAETRSPEEEHNLLLLRAAGRVPDR